MIGLMRRFARLSKSIRKAGRTGSRPRLDLLEDRLQPSLTGLPLDGVQAHAVTGFHHLDFAAQSTVATDAHAMLSLSTATYITGTTGTATARGIALGQDGSTYQTGTITQQDGSKEAYVAKSDPTGKQVFLFTFQAVDITVPDITFMN